MLVIIIKKNLKEAESAKKGRPGHTIFGASCHTMFGTFCHTIFGASFGRLLTTTSKRKMKQFISRLMLESLPIKRTISKRVDVEIANT